MRRYVSAFAALLFLAASPAAAQEKGKIGVTMGFPESVGVIWHATDKLALRPEFSLEWTGSEVETVEIEGNSFSTGLSALFYLRKWDDLATYVSPRYAFSRRRTTSEGIFGIDSESTIHTHLFAGSFGAQYFLGARFSVFGELGLEYRKASREDEDRDDPSSHSFGTRSTVGISFYF